jgi:hypothetical protein
MKFKKLFLFPGVLISMIGFIPAFAQDQVDTADQQKTETSLEIPAAADAESGVAPEQSNMTFKIHGWGSYEFGEIVSGHFANDAPLSKVWRQRVYANIKGVMTVSDRIQMVVAPEVLMYSRFPVNETQNFRQDIKAQYAVYLDEAYFGLALGEVKKPWMALKVGYFKFKYNQDVRNLGEYMFRSACYPTYITTVFDHAFQRLLGMEIYGNLFDSLLHYDAIINSHTEFYPRDDYNLTGFLDVTPVKGFTFGVGAQLDRILPTNQNKTTPKTPANMYYKSSALDSLGNIVYPDTGYYTFAGTKLMARFNFDPKMFFRGVRIFGENDLKLYGEVAVLGVANQVNADTSQDRSKHPYEKVFERTPFMLGFNVPTFRILDVFTLEIQPWTSNPWANEFLTVRRMYLPLRYKTNGWDMRTDGNNHNENFKWSVYLKKTFLDHFSVIGAVAFDNLLDVDETDYEPLCDFEETYRYRGDWYWRIKVQGEF